MKKALLLGAFFLWGMGAHMAYAWFDADYIHPVERYEMDRHDYEHNNPGDWNAPYMNFAEWEANQVAVEHQFGVEVADAFDWFGLEGNADTSHED